jgi:hypothetical protein
MIYNPLGKDLGSRLERFNYMYKLVQTLHPVGLSRTSTLAKSRQQ